MMVPMENFDAVVTEDQDGNTFNTSVLVPSYPKKFFADLQRSSENGIQFTSTDWPGTTLLSIVPGGIARGFSKFEDSAVLSMYLDKEALKDLRDKVNAVLLIL